jgi:hypothetical protein
VPVFPPGGSCPRIDNNPDHKPNKILGVDMTSVDFNIDIDCILIFIYNKLIEALAIHKRLTKKNFPDSDSYENTLGTILSQNGLKQLSDISDLHLELLDLLISLVLKNSLPKKGRE